MISDRLTLIYILLTIFGSATAGTLLSFAIFSDGIERVISTISLWALFFFSSLYVGIKKEWI